MRLIVEVTETQARLERLRVALREVLGDLERGDRVPVVPRFSPMLASTGSITDRVEAWAFEPELDGWRALVYRDASLIVRTRNGHDITASLPDMSPLTNALAGRHVVLDGELAHRGRPIDFYLLGPRFAALRAERFDLDGPAARGYGHERLDQLVNELLLGVR